MILVPLLNPKFATVPAAKSCELRVRGTSRLLKFVFEGGGCATLIQDRALRRTKDSARPGPGFENFASFASIGVFQQPARACSSFHRKRNTLSQKSGQLEGTSWPLAPGWRTSRMRGVLRVWRLHS